MDEVQQTSVKQNLKDESVETAKQLVPWRAGLPWWVVLVEGIVLGLIGILILIDPRQTIINVALFTSAALLVAGALQLWAVLRGKVPESVDALIAARGAIGVFAGAIILLLFFLNYLSPEAGLIVFGLGSLIYGLMGFAVAFSAEGARRRSSIVEGVFFGFFGVLLLYVLVVGSEAVEMATSVVAWAAIIGGLALIGLSFYNRSRDQNQEEPTDNGETGAQKGQEQDKSANQAKAPNKEPGQPDARV